MQLDFVPPQAAVIAAALWLYLYCYRDWEFSWLARNLAPVRNQKIHWISEPGSASMGLNVNNRGQIRCVGAPHLGGLLRGFTWTAKGDATMGLEGEVKHWV